ncbi:hypothetical protein LCGC14_2364130 [marine sediment metagenome]|uniref:Uncharacterized protein n=1 Tax=marine sediment metagenome TaxID=412755 RepID=A0A0F9C5L8_9ZZZZ
MTRVRADATTTALATSLVVKAKAGTLYGLTGDNNKSSEQFIQIHDAAALPANGAVPKIVFRVPATKSFSLDYNKGREFQIGIVICNSSTAATKTIGSADCWFDVQYI